MYNKLRVYCLVIIVVNVTTLKGGQFNFEQLEINQGIDLVHDICRDKTGYLWIINGFQGILSHDSYTSTAYLHSKTDTTSLSHNEAFCLHVDPYNKLWVGTANGLNLFNRETKTFTRYFCNTESDLKKNNRIFQVYTSPDSSLWVVLENAICKYDYSTGTFEIKNVPAEYKNLELNGIVEDTEGHIWVVTTKEFLLEYCPKTNTFTKVIDPFSIKGASIQRKIYIDSEADIWLTTKGEGLIKFNTKTKVFKHYPVNSYGTGTANKLVFDLLFLKDGKIMLAVDQGGINILDKKTDKFTYHNQNNSSLQTNGIFCFWLDCEGILWVGTSRNGVLLQNPYALPFQNYQFKNETNKASNNIVGCIHEDNKNNIWIGTDGGGLWVLDSNLNKLAHYTVENSIWLKSNVIRKIDQDKNGHIVVASWNQLVSIKTEDKEIASKFNKQLLTISPAGTLWGFHVDSKKRFWMELPDGEVALFDEDYNFVRRFLSPKQGAFNDSPKVIEDRGGGYYFSNYSGIYYYKDNNEEPICIIPTERVSAYCVNDKYIAVGGMDFGVCLYEKNGTFIKEFTEKNKLSSNIVKSMEFDENQKLWVSTINGLNYIDIEEDKIKQYYKGDGLVANQFFMQSMLKTKRGKLYFGAYDGLVTLQPQRVKTNSIAPKVHINKIAIYNDYRFENRVRNIIPDKERIVLSWKERMFIIDFLAINFINPGRSKYAYKLEGFNTNWIQAGADKRTATYTNLHPGVYTFKVKASNGDGVWNNEGASIEIKLKPPFWKTKLWYAVLVSLILLIFYSVLKFREYRLKYEKKVLEVKIQERTSIISDQKEELQLQTEELEKHRYRLEELVEERTKELKKAKEQAELSDKLKMRFLANMSHEVRTPMNAILGFVNLIQHINPKKEKRDYYFKTINQSAKSLMHLIEDIIDISQIESSQLIVNLKKIEISLLLQDLYVIFKSKAERNNQTLVFVNNKKNKNQTVYTDDVRVRQIVINLLKNAIVFCENGNIELGLYVEGDSCVVYVKDDGPGISKENQEIIYESFTTLDDSANKVKRGVGLGLTLSKRLAGLLRAELTLDSDKDKGSTFMLKLPLQLPEE